MMPPAPGRCSTTNGWPRLACSRSATMRASRSAVPAAENGTTILTGRVGHACAQTCPGATHDRSAPRTSHAAGRRIVEETIRLLPPTSSWLDESALSPYWHVVAGTQRIPLHPVVPSFIVAAVPPRPQAPSLMRKTLLGFMILAVAWVGYLAWPLYDLVQLVHAVERGDVVAVTHSVDFARLRASLTQQIVEAYLQRVGGVSGGDDV